MDVAADGEDGLFAGLNYPVDAAIVDLGLPKVPGLEIIQRWRARQRTFPILILTAREGWQDKVAGLDAGADDYVSKPFQLSGILRASSRPAPATTWMDYVGTGMRPVHAEHLRACECAGGSLGADRFADLVEMSFQLIGNVGARVR